MLSDGTLSRCYNAAQLPLLVMHPNAINRPAAFLEAVPEENITLLQLLYSPCTRQLFFTSLFDPDTFAETNAL